MNYCPECKAEVIHGKDCFVMLGEVIEWEYQDSDLLREHFLTVATYNLQHPSQFTDEVLETLRSSVAAYLDGSMSVDQIRAKHSQLFEGSTKVLRPVSERIMSPRSWSRTVSNVYAPGRVGAAVRVKEWAEVVRTESGN